MFHIVYIFVMRPEYVDFFCSRLDIDRITGAEERMCEQVRPRSWKQRRWNEVWWAGVRLCALAQAWNKGLDLAGWNTWTWYGMGK